MKKIKTWDKRLGTVADLSIEEAMQAEIRDLRATLAIETAALADAVRHIGNLKERLASQVEAADYGQLSGNLAALAGSMDASGIASRSEAALVLKAAHALAQRAASAPASRTQLLPMQTEEDQEAGIIREWFFDCDGHYLDVARDKDGKYSVLFRNRADATEVWHDQAAPPAAAKVAQDSWRDAARIQQIDLALEKLVQAWQPKIASAQVVQARKNAKSEVFAAIDAAMAAQQGEKP